MIFMRLFYLSVSLLVVVLLLLLMAFFLLSLLVLLQCMYKTESFFQPQRVTFVSKIITIPTRSHHIKLNAKSKSKSEKRGFGKQVVKPDPSSIDSQLSGVDSLSSGQSTIAPVTTNTATSTSGNGKSKSQQEVFQKYNIKATTKEEFLAPSDSSGKKIKKKSIDDADYVFGESVLQRIPPKLLARIDTSLVTLTFLSLVVVVITGVAISFGAYKVVFPDVQIPADFDNAITNVIAPAFSPALAVFFFFSITFGIFKFAQVSSSQTMYQE